MRLFLRMRAWQVFLLLYGSQILVSASGMIAGDSKWMFAGMVSGVFVFLVFIAWYWSLGTNLNKKIPEEIRMRSGFFRFGTICGVAVSVPCLLVFFVIVAIGEFGRRVFALLVPSYVFGIFCVFYGFYFIAKNLVMAENKRKVGFHEFVGAFLLMWMYPIGIWFIQPRVNRLFEEEMGTQ
jgi:hypothetical protein